MNPAYNAEQIDRNVALLIKCTLECVEKLTQNHQDPRRRILETRLAESWKIADFVLSWFRELPEDEYIKARLGEIEELRRVYQDYLLKKERGAAA